MKLNENQTLFSKLIISLLEQMYKNHNDTLSELCDPARNSNKEQLVNELSRIMFKYNIKDNCLSINKVQQMKVYKELCEKINNMFDNEYLVEKDCIENIINKSATDSYYINSFVTSIGINYNLKPVSDYELNKIINHKIDDELWSDRLWENKKNLRKDLKLQVKKFLNGQTNVNEISDILQKKYKNNRYVTTRLVNDNIAHVQEEANKVWKENHNISTDLYMGTLDYKICDKCKPYDGKTFNVNDGPEPPIHVGCRCIRVAIINENWRPSQRLDNETKKRVSWKDYEEWYRNNRHPFVMDLQAFGVDNWKLLQEKIEKGIINNDQFNMCYSEFNKIFQDGVQTPLENIKCAEHTFVHIAQRHPYMVDLNEIRNIKKTLINPNSIYETQDKNGFKARGYIRKIGEDILLIISRGDIISAYYPNDRYLKNNIIDGGNLLWENK